MSKKTPSIVSAETLNSVLKRIEELEKQVQANAQIKSRIEELEKQRASDQIEQKRQAKEIYSLNKKNLVLKAKVDGQEDGFYLLDMLPPELRHMVWKFALTSRRVVELGEAAENRYVAIRGNCRYAPRYIEAKQDPRHHSWTEITDFPHIFDNSGLILSLLLTCKESYEITIREVKTYETCLTYNLCSEEPANYTYFPMDAKEGDLPTPHAEFEKYRGVQFRPDTDIIFLPYSAQDALDSDREWYDREWHGHAMDALYWKNWDAGLDCCSIKMFALDVRLLSRFWEVIGASGDSLTLLFSLNQLILVESSVWEKVWFDDAEFDNMDGLLASVKAAMEEFLCGNGEALPDVEKIPEITWMREDAVRALT